MHIEGAWVGKIRAGVTFVSIPSMLSVHGGSQPLNYLPSYGSVVAAHVLHTPKIAPKIGPMLFIDPVTFLLHLPDVAYNFVTSSLSLDSSQLTS